MILFKTFIPYVLLFFILRLRLRPMVEGQSLSGPNIRLRPKVKIAPTVQHCFFSNFKSKLLPTSLNMDFQFHTNEVILFYSLFINSNTGQNIVLVYLQKCKNFRFSWRLWVGLKKDCHDRKGLLWTIIVTAVNVSKANGLKWLKQNIFSPTDQKQGYRHSSISAVFNLPRLIILSYFPPL
jgi:hypothetical protein